MKKESSFPVAYFSICFFISILAATVNSTLFIWQVLLWCKIPVLKILSTHCKSVLMMFEYSIWNQLINNLNYFSFFKDQNDRKDTLISLSHKLILIYSKIAWKFWSKNYLISIAFSLCTFWKSIAPNLFDFNLLLSNKTQCLTNSQLLIV